MESEIYPPRRESSSNSRFEARFSDRIFQILVLICSGAVGWIWTHQSNDRERIIRLEVNADNRDSALTEIKNDIREIKNALVKTNRKE